MSKPVLPDYHNCGLNVAASVLRHFGAACVHPTHPDVDALLSRKKYKNIVVMLFDGLGMATMDDHLPKDSFLSSHIARQMTAVFPSTTVAATTSIESGDSPCEHGWLGWSMYFYQIDRMVDVFVNLDSRTGKPMGGDVRVIDQYRPYHNICQRLNATGSVSAHIVSRFGTDRIQTLDEMFDTAAALCRAPGRRYVYTYWGEPDHTMHDLGVAAVGDMVRDIDDRVCAFCQSMEEDTLVLVTADHGLLDCEYVYISDHPQLEQALIRPFHIEARAAGFYVKPECRTDFPRLFDEAFGHEHFWLVDTDEALAMGLFGGGTPRADIHEIIGDYIAIAVDKYALVNSRKEKTLTAMHAGMTAREMYVPLIAAKV